MFKPKKKAPVEEVEEVEEVVEQENDIEDEFEDDIEEVEEVVPQPKTKTIPSKKIWSIQEVATQTAQVIVNSKTNQSYDLASAIVELLNRTEK